MTKDEIIIKGPIAATTAFGAYMVGLFNEMFLVLLTVMVIDYATGVLRGLLTNSLNSTVGLKGILKKIAILIVIGTSGCVEFVLQTLGVDTGNKLVMLVICFFFVNEVISCLENAAQLGAPIPNVLYQALEKLREIGGKEQQVNLKNLKAGVIPVVPAPVIVDMVEVATVVKVEEEKLKGEEK